MKPTPESSASPAVLPDHLQPFRVQALAQGYEEPLLRHWDPDTMLDTHTHPFDAWAVMVMGEMELTAQGERHTLRAGDTFSLVRDTPHEERYGPQGAAYWVARRS